MLDVSVVVVVVLDVDFDGDGDVNLDAPPLTNSGHAPPTPRTGQAQGLVGQGGPDR